MSLTTKTAGCRLPAADELAQRYGADSIEPVTIGRSEAAVYRLSRNHEVCYLKLQPVLVDALSGEPLLAFKRGVELLDWLHGKLPVPQVLNYQREAYQGNDIESLLVTAVPGLNAVDSMASMPASELVDLLATGLRQVHSVDITDCPFDERVEAKLQRAHQRVQLGVVDETDFDDERLGQTALQVYQQLLQKKPMREDLVFGHGDYCLPNVMLAQRNVSGFIDLDRAGVADRYNDLAIATRSIGYNLGAQYEQQFLSTYGLDEVDEDKIAYYRMMDEMF